MYLCVLVTVSGLAGRMPPATSKPVRSTAATQPDAPELAAVRLQRHARLLLSRRRYHQASLDHGIGEEPEWLSAAAGAIGEPSMSIPWEIGAMESASNSTSRGDSPYFPYIPFGDTKSNAFEREYASLLEARKRAVDEQSEEEPRSMLDATPPPAMSAAAERAMEAARAMDLQRQLEAQRRQEEQLSHYRDLAAQLEDERTARRHSEAARLQERKASEMLEASHKLLSTMLQQSLVDSPADASEPDGWSDARASPSPRARAAQPHSSGGRSGHGMRDEEPSAAAPAAPAMEAVARAVAAAKALSEEASLRDRVERVLRPHAPVEAVGKSAASRRHMCAQLSARAHAANRRGDARCAAAGFADAHAWMPSTSALISSLNMHLKGGQPALALLGYWRLLNDSTLHEAALRPTSSQRALVQRKMVDAADEVERLWLEEYISPPSTPSPPRSPLASTPRSTLTGAPSSSEHGTDVLELAPMSAPTQPAPRSPSPQTPPGQQPAAQIEAPPPTTPHATPHATPIADGVRTVRREHARAYSGHNVPTSPVEGSGTVWLLALWVCLAAWALRESLSSV